MVWHASKNQIAPLSPIIQGVEIDLLLTFAPMDPLARQSRGTYCENWHAAR